MPEKGRGKAQTPGGFTSTRHFNFLRVTLPHGSVVSTYSTKPI